MKILIVDDQFFSLQEHLVRNGHEVWVYLDSAPMTTEEFTPYPIREQHIGTLHHATDRNVIFRNRFDLVIVGTEHDTPHWEFFKLHQPALRYRLMGYSQLVRVLEHDRTAAFAFNNYLGMGQYGLLNPEQIVFFDASKARDFLLDDDDDWVLKQSNDSPLDRTNNRTVLSNKATKKSVAVMLSTLNASNPWFTEDGNGGVVFERRHKGYEMSFGAFFDGRSFVGDYYTYEEHKGAYPGNLGGLLTGEIGTTMHWWPWKDDSRLCKILRRLESTLKGQCAGMIDINTILDTVTGNLHFIEYTIRFGRPTLDMQVALFDWNEMDLGSYWAEMVPRRTGTKRRHGYPSVPSVFSTGVTAFSYGVPLHEPEVDYPIEIPAGATQLFAMYDNPTETWWTRRADRLFLSVGFGLTPEKANANAYSRLDGYEANQVVWRSDIGRKTRNLTVCLEHLGMIPSCCP